VVGVCGGTGSCARADDVMLNAIPTAIAKILIRLFIKLLTLVVCGSRESKAGTRSLWRKVLVS
jgi:hypothetical protein